jgi:hypothetical protein
MTLRPQPNPDTVNALLDTTWRVAGAESAQTDALDRKAASLATFASLVLSLTAALSGRLVEAHESAWVFALYATGLALLVAAIGVAVWVLLPKEQLTLGIAYLERFPMWSESRKPREQVQGETMAGLIAAIARERRLNGRKANAVRASFLILLAGLAVTTGAGAIVIAESVV